MPPPAGQAIPAVHDLTNKFVKDPHKIQSYYHQKGAIAKAVSGGQRRQDEEYSATGSQIPVFSEKSGTPSVFGGSRMGTANKKSRKDAQSIGGVGTPLTQMKSQGKIMIKKSRGSQRTNSAMRSPKGANAAPSSSTSKDNALKSSHGIR